MKKIAHLLLVLAVVATTLASTAQAREGRLDRHFGVHGSVLVANSVIAVGQQGSIALLNRKRLMLLAGSGKPDSRFGRDGIIRVPERVAGWLFEPVDVALDSRGRPLLFGSVAPAGSQTVAVGPYLEGVPITRGAVLRFLPDGRRAPGFGQDGAVVSDFGLRSEELEEQNVPTTKIAGGIVDSLDRPLFAAGVAGGSSPCAGHSFIGWRPSAIVRLTPSGLPDPEFGEGDGVSPRFPRFAGSPFVSLSVSGDDQPLMGGALTSGCREGASVFRLSEEGTALPGYGTGGRLNFPNMRFVAFTPEGGAILERRRFKTEILRRVTAEGRPDQTFGRDGRLTLKMPPSAIYYPEAAVDPEGRVLIVGSYSLPAAGPRAKHAFIFVERLLRSGRRDPAFGRRGRITVMLPGGRNAGSFQVALDSSGRLLVLSELTKPHGWPLGRAVLTRFLLD